LPAIAFKEEAEGQKACALIAVIEGMVTNYAERIRGRQTRQIRFGLVRVQVKRPGQRRLQAARVAQARQAAMLSQGFPVQQHHGPSVNPFRRFHLANARNVSRYLAINSRPLAS
jgi:hypothetical protein